MNRLALVLMLAAGCASERSGGVKVADSGVDPVQSGPRRGVGVKDDAMASPDEISVLPGTGGIFGEPDGAPVVGSGGMGQGGAKAGFGGMAGDSWPEAGRRPFDAWNDAGPVDHLPVADSEQDLTTPTVCTRTLRILSLGQPATYRSGSDSQDAFQAFLNSNTNGTATMEMLRIFTPITSLDLSMYDLVILQALEDSEYTAPWTYSDADAAAMRDWVTNKGGAIITMSGYGANITEVQPLNQLLNGQDKWSGISYNTDDTFKPGDCTDNLCYCSYGTIPFSEWGKSCAECAAITVNHDGTPLGKVGIFRGRSINCTGSGCQVFAKDSTGGTLGVARLIGRGRVLTWGDEWVTFTSQWGLTPDPNYDDAVKYAKCAGHTTMTSYTVPQFWYNIIRWAAPASTCFTITLPPGSAASQQIVF